MRNSKNFFSFFILLFLYSCNQEANFHHAQALQNKKDPDASLRKNDKNNEALKDKIPEIISDSMDEDTVDDPEDDDELCLRFPKACDLKPVVTQSGVVTILLALGDLAREKLVISEESARIIAQSAVKFASPVSQPKILVIKDFNHNNESPYDTEYTAKVLLANYKTDIFYESPNGIEKKNLEGYDVVWFNNPGHPMGSKNTMLLLKEFAGGVIMAGDDLTQGRGFSPQELTGLKFIDNGTSVKCDGKTYIFDNNSAHQYQVTLSEEFLPGIPLQLRTFAYGNDIDNSQLTVPGSKFQVLASGLSDVGGCQAIRPVIVRYQK